MGKLIIVPTPIGNLEDITLRAIRILREVDLILAEDTRTTSILLNHYQIKNRLQSHHKFNEHKTIEDILQRIRSGQIIALVSDAGTPSISDPGFLIVRACIQNNLVVECLPGPTAMIPALVLSGLPCERFCFEGFLPLKKGRQTRLSQLSVEERSIIFYESPHRLLKTLSQLAIAFGEKRIVSISRELTKRFEETYRGTLFDSINYFSINEPKGEFVIIVAGLKNKTTF